MKTIHSLKEKAIKKGYIKKSDADNDQILKLGSVKALQDTIKASNELCSRDINEITNLIKNYSESQISMKWEVSRHFPGNYDHQITSNIKIEVNWNSRVIYVTTKAHNTTELPSNPELYDILYHHYKLDNSINRSIKLKNDLDFIKKELERK